MEFENWCCNDYAEGEEAVLDRVNYLINEKQRYLEKKKADIEKLEYERDLIQKDIVNTIKTDLNQSAYNIFRSYDEYRLFMNAWYYARHLIDKVKYDDKTLEEYKSSYELVTTLIKMNLIPEKYRDLVSFGSIYTYDYNNYSFYEFILKVNDFEFSIEIPIFENANTDNYHDLLGGYQLRKRYEMYNDLIYKSLDYTDFSANVEYWLDKQLAGENKDEKAN